MQPYIKELGSVCFNTTISARLQCGLELTSYKYYINITKLRHFDEYPFSLTGNDSGLGAFAPFAPCACQIDWQQVYTSSQCDKPTQRLIFT